MCIFLKRVLHGQLPKYLSILFCLLSIQYQSFAQNTSTYHYLYDTVVLDSTMQVDPHGKMSRYIDKKRLQLHENMDKVVAIADAPIKSYSPFSPLSNLLTDMLFDYGNTYMLNSEGDSADLALLNFGGIRLPLPEGKITIGDLYLTLPFDNKIVIISMKGSELLKIFSRFTAKKNQPYAQMQIIYNNEKPRKITVKGQSVSPDKLYNLVTVDFIATGGDRILSGIVFEKIMYTEKLLRDMAIEALMNKYKNGQTLSPNYLMDKRVDMDIMWGKETGQ